MTIEKEMELKAEYMECRSDLGFCCLILLACFGTFIFVAVKGFWPGVLVVLVIQTYTMFRAEKYQDRMKEIRWEFDRG